MKDNHAPVLLPEALAGLKIKSAGFYIDGTLGRAGHAKAIHAQLSSGGKLWCFDKDIAAIDYAKNQFSDDGEVNLIHASFADLEFYLRENDKKGQVDGILLDLGVSSPQLDQAYRGFSFMQDGPLDMRMNSTTGITAAEWLNTAEQIDIKRVLFELGEENFAGLIAKNIVQYRDRAPFESTKQLASLIERTIPKRFQPKNKHAATRTFQAIRMHINNELSDLDVFLQNVVGCLKSGGRLAVISFHSLEDRIVKRFIQKQEKGPVLPKNIPLTELKRGPHLRKVGKAIKPQTTEIATNVRARSAILRIAEKVSGHDGF